MQSNRWAATGRRTIQLGTLGLLLAAASPASAEQKIYWSDQVFPPGIKKSNVDGSNVEIVMQQSVPNGGAVGLELDAVAGKIYWTDVKNLAIKRANRDGSSVETLVSGLGNPGGIALDLTNGKVYWTDRGASSIERANLDGTGREVVLAGLPNPSDVALDVAGGKMYWVEANFVGALRRASLDGTVVENLLG